MRDFARRPRLLRFSDRFAGPADDLPLLDRIAGLDVNGTQVSVKRKQGKPVIPDDGIAVDTQVAADSRSAADGFAKYASIGIYSIPMNNGEKPLIWLGGSRKDLAAMPKAVQREFGYALHLAQIGSRHAGAKVLRGFGSSGVLEVVENFARLDDAKRLAQGE